MSAPKALRVMVITTIPQTMAAFFEKQLRMMAEEGFEVHAVSSPGAALDKLDAGSKVQRHALFMERKPRPLRDLKSLWQMFRLMRRIRPHIVHSHTPKAGLLGMIAAKLAGVPVRLYTVHGLPLETRTGMKRKILEFAERASATFSTSAYSVSRSVREIVVRFGLCPAGKIAVLGDGSCAGVDTEVFSAASQRPRLSQDETIALFVGRLSRDKGVEVLASAWREIAVRCPQLRLVIAGELDETDPVSPEAMHVLQTHPQVRMLGSVDKAQIPALYSAVDFTILPTFREGLSQVALESGAMGLPIVSTRVCGLDAVIDGVTGLLVEARNPNALAGAVCQLAGDESLRRRLGTAAREHIQTHYCDTRVNQLWSDEYRRLVRESFPEHASHRVRQQQEVRG